MHKSILCIHSYTIKNRDRSGPCLWFQYFLDIQQHQRHKDQSHGKPLLFLQPLPEYQDARNRHHQDGRHAVHRIGDDSRNSAQCMEKETSREVVRYTDHDAEADFRFANGQENLCGSFQIASFVEKGIWKNLKKDLQKCK